MHGDPLVGFDIGSAVFQFGRDWTRLSRGSCRRRRSLIILAVPHLADFFPRIAAFTPAARALAQLFDKLLHRRVVELDEVVDVEFLQHPGAAVGSLPDTGAAEAQLTAE